MTLRPGPTGAGPYRGHVLVDDVGVAAFAALRPLLFTVAYRLLGQASDA